MEPSLTQKSEKIQLCSEAQDSSDPFLLKNLGIWSSITIGWKVWDALMSKAGFFPGPHTQNALQHKYL